jgi:hypothetical protein
MPGECQIISVFQCGFKQIGLPAICSKAYFGIGISLQKSAGA